MTARRSNRVGGPPGRSRRVRRPPRRSGPPLLALAALLAGVAAPAAAQTGGISVRVVDDGAAPLPGATVTLASRLGLTPQLTRITASNGAVEFPVLQVGSGYVVEVAFPGFARQRLDDLRVSSGQVEQVVVQLSPSIEERVQVRADSEVVDLEATGNTTRFGDDFIENLPVLDRLYQNVLTLAPGVKDADEDGNPNVHGARSRDFKALVGGVSNVDPLTGEWLSSVNLDTIEELEVITSGAGVEFGRAQGGFARVLQKQGSNEFEGVFNVIVRSSELDGDGAASGLAVSAPKFETLQPALQVSGPIVKDRLWYRLSHEFVSREDPVNVVGAIDVTTRRQVQSADQITWQASPRNKLAFQFQYDPLRVANLDLSSRVRQESSRTLERGGPTYSLTWTGAHSATLLAQTLVSYQDNQVEVLPSTTGVANSCLTFVRQPALNETLCQDVTVNQASGSHFELSEDRRQRFTARSDVTWFAGRTGPISHRLKLGLIVENERYFRTLERRGYIHFFERVMPLFPPPQVIGVTRGTVFVPRRSSARAVGTTWAAYVEDQLQPRPGLVITAGLRFDREEISSKGRDPFDPQAEAERFYELFDQRLLPLEEILRRTFTAYEGVVEVNRLLAEALQVNENTVFAPFTFFSSDWERRRELAAIDIANNNLAPRLSVAWDPWNNGKTKFAVSAGRYYDKIFLAVPLVELEPVEMLFETDARPPADHLRSPLLVNRNLTEFLPPITRVVDRELSTPYQDELTFSVERELFSESSIKLTRIQRLFEDQLQDVDINHDATGQAYNPGWSEILLIGNFNTAEYEAWVLEVTRRYHRGWELQASYTRSEAVGDAEDFSELLGNALSVRDAERSWLDYDQRHVLRLNVIALTSWGWRIGGQARYESGLPYSWVNEAVLNFHNPPEYQIGIPGTQLAFIYPTGRRNDRRNEGFWSFDLRLQREVQLARGALLQVSAEVFNVLNDDTLIQEALVGGSFSGTRRFGRRFQLGARVQF